MIDPSSSESPSRAIMAGIAYFAVVFAIGFVLGTIRVLWLAPQAGEEVAVLLETPVILGACAWAAWWLTGWFAVRTLGEALVMGALGFALLMAAELALAVTAFSMSPREWLASLFVPPGLWGLLGQIAFGLFPVVAALLRR